MTTDCPGGRKRVRGAWRVALKMFPATIAMVSESASGPPPAVSVVDAAIGTIPDEPVAVASLDDGGHRKMMQAAVAHSAASMFSIAGRARVRVIAAAPVREA